MPTALILAVAYVLVLAVGILFLRGCRHNEMQMENDESALPLPLDELERIAFGTGAARTT